MADFAAAAAMYADVLWGHQVVSPRVGRMRAHAAWGVMGGLATPSQLCTSLRLGTHLAVVLGACCLMAPKPNPFAWHTILVLLEHMCGRERAQPRERICPDAIRFPASWNVILAAMRCAYTLPNEQDATVMQRACSKSPQR